MDKSNKKKARLREIRNFLAVIFSGVLAAILMAGVLVYYYNPSGRYTVDQVVLNPETATQLSGEEGKGGVRFDGVEYHYDRGDNRGWLRVPVSSDAYVNFYGLIDGQKSLRGVDEALVRRFQSEKAASVVIKVSGGRTEGSRVLQEIQILPDGYYRVELRQIEDSNPWAYFYKSGLYEEAKEAFLPSGS